MRVYADDEVCCGSGVCAMHAPEVFDQDPTVGTVILLDPVPPERLHAAVRTAIRECPSRALRATEL
ncbi:MAG TPA: ferredoxin [Mycobacterium sp.]|nr:ferredoxin [Mycobacterium sp.]